MKTLTAFAVVAILATGLAACSAGDDAGDDGLRIVATTSILADVVSNAVGEGAQVEALMGPGTDPHDFAPSARQVAAIRSADLVVANGLGLEQGLVDVLASADADGVEIIELAPLVDPIPFGDTGAHDEDEGEGHDEDEGEEHDDHGDLDPHFWEDPLRMATAVAALGDRLEAIDPSIDWAATTSEYIQRLEATHAEMVETFDAIPPEDRVIVTNHDALGYLAERFDFEVVAVVISGGSTLAEPSAADLAHLVEVIQERGVKAIFTDNTAPSTLAETVAAEVDSPLAVVELYSGSLGEADGPAATYIDMLLTNATAITDALR